MLRSKQPRIDQHAPFSRILETTLLTGPYDWDERVLPRSEFDARLERVRAQMAVAGVNVLIVHGDPRHYNALAYLTNFTPKNGTGLALVPREGSLRILSSGTPKMMDAGKRLTWVEDVRPLGNAPKTVAVREDGFDELWRQTVL